MIDYTAHRKAEHPQNPLRTPLSLLKIELIIAASTFLPAWPAPALFLTLPILLGPAAAPTSPLAPGSLGLVCLTSLSFSSSCPSCLWKERLLLTTDECVVIFFLFFFFGFHHVTIHFLNYQMSTSMAIFVFSLQKYVMAREISTMVFLKPLRYFFCTLWLYQHDLK